MATTETEADRGVPAGWGADAIPSQQGKTAIVTGANAGIGFEAALQLARHGAHVVLACRNAARAEAAAARIREALADTDGTAGSVETMALDTSSQESVRAFAAQFRAKHDKLHLLVNNAGVMAVPFSLTVDGHERQFATNHLGHFALTAQLFDMLKASVPDARIVNVSSHAHREGSVVARERLQTTNENDYSSGGAYSQSKLYNLVFAKELARRMEAAGVSGVSAVACHPGFTRTNLFNVPATEHGWFMRQVWKIVAAAPVYQDAASGALPTLYAATGTTVKSGDYYGPGGFLALWGAPKLEQPAKTVESAELAQSLWEESEALAKLKFDVK